MAVNDCIHTFSLTLGFDFNDFVDKNDASNGDGGDIPMMRREFNNYLAKRYASDYGPMYAKRNYATYEKRGDGGDPASFEYDMF